MAGNNWANRAKEQTKGIALSKPSSDKGTRYEGSLKAATLKSYKTGSFGVELQYALNEPQKTVYENVVLSTLSAEGALVPTQYGASTLKRRLQAFGLTADEVNAIGTPRTIKDAFNISSVIGTGVAVYCRNEEYMGKPKLAVRSVFPLDGNVGNNGGNAA
jgi:hypothetical protein